MTNRLGVSVPPPASPLNPDGAAAVVDPATEVDTLPLVPVAPAACPVDDPADFEPAPPLACPLSTTSEPAPLPAPVSAVLVVEVRRPFDDEDEDVEEAEDESPAFSFSFEALFGSFPDSDLGEVWVLPLPPLLLALVAKP